MEKFTLKTAPERDLASHDSYWAASWAERRAEHRTDLRVGLPYEIWDCSWAELRTHYRAKLRTHCRTEHRAKLWALCWTARWTPQRRFSLSSPLASAHPPLACWSDPLELSTLLRCCSRTPPPTQSRRWLYLCPSLASRILRHLRHYRR